MARWQLQDAKARLSELVDRARREGPQHITVRGRSAAVVLSEQEYRRLTEPKPGIVEFLRSSPFVGVDLDLDRDRSADRNEDLPS